MIDTRLTLPERDCAPRQRGLTMVIDPGLHTGRFEDAIDSVGEYIDMVKFGWGTALVTDQHQEVKVLIGEVERASGQERATAYRAFQDLLAAHEAVEELVLHPALMNVADGNSVVHDRVAEEHQATALLQQLEQFDIDDPRFAITFAELAKAVTQHAEAEEHMELTMLLPLVDDDVAGRMVAALQAVGSVADGLGYDGPLGPRGFAATLDAAKAEVAGRGLTESAGR